MKALFCIVILIFAFTPAIAQEPTADDLKDELQKLNTQSQRIVGQLQSTQAYLDLLYQKKFDLEIQQQQVIKQFQDTNARLQKLQQAPKQEIPKKE